MKWEEKKLEEITFIKGGKRLPKGHEFTKVVNTHPYIRARDIKEGIVDIQDPVFISESTYNLISNYTVKKDDVLITIVGANIGDVAQVSEELDGANLTENAVKLRVIDDSKLNKKFLKYALIGDYQKRKFQHVAAGAAQGKLGLYKIKPFTIPLPPLPTQRRIASILSAYDDLIENNLKRIKLLEEAAQHIYREWFVHFRFPGWEEVEFGEDGLPEGWAMKSFSEAVQINPKTTPDKETLSPYIPMKSLSENNMVISEIEERLPKGGAKFINGDTLFARITPCLENGKTGFVQFLENSQVATGSTEFIVFRETEFTNRYFIYITSRNYRFRQNAIKSMTGSDGRQRVKPEAFEKYRFPLPPKKLMSRFGELCAPIFDKIQILTSHNQSLKQARDILLPRLMNQTIQV